MSAGAWMIGLVLVGQVSSGNGRYSAAGGTNPFSQGGTTSGNSGNTGGAGLVPIIEPSSQGGRATQGTSTPSGQTTNPYARSTTPIGSGSGSTYPPPAAAGSATSPFGSSTLFSRVTQRHESLADESSPPAEPRKATRRAA